MIYRKLGEVTTKKRCIICIDFDGTITDGDPSLVLRSGAKEYINKLSDVAYIWIFSNRSNPEQRNEIRRRYGVDCLEEMIDVLNREGIRYDRILTEEDVEMKAPYDFIIDDRSVPPFDGDWKKAYEYIMMKINEPGFESMIDKFEWVLSV